MHEVLVNRLGGLSLPRKSVVRLTDRPDMTLDVYHGRKTTMQQSSFNKFLFTHCMKNLLRVQKNMDNFLEYGYNSGVATLLFISSLLNGDQLLKEKLCLRRLLLNL